MVKVKEAVRQLSNNQSFVQKSVETVETAGDVEVIEKFKAGVAAKGGVAIETFEAIEAAGDVEVKEAEGK